MIDSNIPLNSIITLFNSCSPFTNFFIFQRIRSRNFYFSCLNFSINWNFKFILFIVFYVSKTSSQLHFTFDIIMILYFFCESNFNHSSLFVCIRWNDCIGYYFPITTFYFKFCSRCICRKFHIIWQFYIKIITFF